MCCHRCCMSISRSCACWSLFCVCMTSQCGQHARGHAFFCRVYKQIRDFTGWVKSHSPSSDFTFVAHVYKVANRHPNLVHTRKLPQLVLEKRDYEVTLEQYGLPANPQTLRVMSALLLKPSLIITAQHTTATKGACLVHYVLV